MKTLNEVYSEIVSSEENRKKFMTLKSESEIVDFVKSFGADASLDEIKTFLNEKQNKTGELTDDELNQVAGGKGFDSCELAISICTLGTGCVALVAHSLDEGSVGTGIKGDGMLCELD